jgi:serine/threonine-protein kinase
MAILRSALARRPEERSRFLQEACRDDPSLRPEVEVLLQSYERLRSRIDQEADAYLGKRIGRYEVLERIGQGAMGVVYKARDPLMRRIVGIKTMSAEIASDPELHDRFYREARSAGNLSHRNIITIYDLGEQDGRPFIAMEFLSGEDVKTKLDRRAKLTLEERVRWMRETLEGLEHAHRKDIIHRDIKPANLFVTREGEVKILDFGLARLTSSVATKTGSVMGTPSYMSPEQVRGEKLDARSDLFSAGATFYELLSFRKPFPGDSIHGVFFKILEKDPEHLQMVNPWLPSDLVELVEKMMAKDRGSRYADASGALEGLRRLEAALPERKRALRVEALGALGRVESLLSKYRGSLGLNSREALAGDETVSLLLPRGTAEEDPAEAITLNELLPGDYLGLAEIAARANEEARGLESKLENVETAGRLLADAANLEARGELEGALARADEALRLASEHRSAASCVDRISRRLAHGDAHWTRARLDQLLREGESRLQAGGLASARERAERALVLEPEDSRALDLKAKVEEELERKRRRRQAQLEASRLVGAARAKLVREDDPEKCLELVSQALALVPGDSDAQALKEKAENRLAHLRSLAVEETALEAIASATLAMRRGELDVAAREIARAAGESPEATEIPALTLLLERAKGVVTDPTVAETQRERKAPPAPAPRISPPRPHWAAHPSRSALPSWVVGGLAAAILTSIGFVSWRAVTSRDVQPAPLGPASTSAPATTSLPLSTTTLVSLTTTARPTTTVPPSTTSTAPVTTAASTTVPITTTIATTTPAPPPTTTPTPTTIASVVPVRPEEQIAELVRRYEQAYESLDVNALGAIYPAVPLAVKNSFQNFKTLELTMETISGPEVSRSTAGPTATAVYRVEQTVEPKVGKTTVSRHRATFVFAGVGSAWIIVRVDFQSDK